MLVWDENESAGSHFEQKLREKMAALAAKNAAKPQAQSSSSPASGAPVTPAAFEVPAEDVPDAEMLGWSGTKSQYQLDVDQAIDSITLQEVYQKLSKNKYANARDRQKVKGDGIKVSCPFPGHADNNPSAWINADKGKGGVGTCGSCDMGFDKFTVAGIAYGLDPKSNFNELNKRMAAELRGVTEPAPAAPPVVVIAAPVAVAPAPAPGDGNTGTPDVEETTSGDLDDSEFPTYDVNSVLPNGNTFLDRYVAEASKADMPREFALWAGMAALSAAVGRRVALKMIEFPTYGNLAICLTSNSASGKSKAVRQAVEVLQAALPYDEMTLMSGAQDYGVQVMNLPGSGESLVESLDVKEVDPATKTVKHRSPSSLVKFEEMQTLVSKSAGRDSAYKAFIIDFTDCNSEISTRSKKNGHDVVKNGFVTFITTTQPGHLRSQFSQRDKASGLLNRFVFPFGKAVLQSSWWDDKGYNMSGAIVMLADINRWAISLQPNSGNEFWIHKETNFDDDAREEWVSKWSSLVSADQIGPHSDLLGRMGLNMMRLTLLFAINEKSTQIKLGHVKSAFGLYGYLRACSLMLAKEVAATEMSDNMTALMGAIEKWEANSKNTLPATKRDIKRMSKHVADLNEEEYNDALGRLMRTKSVHHMSVKSGNRTRECWTTEPAKWAK